MNTQPSEPISVLGGRLIRCATDTWQWKDGTPEPRVRDLQPGDQWNFRCRSHAKTTYVEVLLGECHRHKESLGWVLAGVEAGKYRQDNSGDHTGPIRATLDDEGELHFDRMRIEPGEDPLHGNEPILHSRAIPKVALVPIEDWEQWCLANPLGATWDKTDEAKIFEQARMLGWTGP